MNTPQDINILILRLIDLMNKKPYVPKGSIFKLIKRYGVEKQGNLYLYEPDICSTYNIAQQYLSTFLFKTSTNKDIFSTKKSILTTMFFGFGVIGLQIPVLELVQITGCSRAVIREQVRKYRFDNVYFSQLLIAYKLNIIQKNK